jgi:murein DD-endopeptidase MepM/ murein hydrolase activator NlpD
MKKTAVLLLLLALAGRSPAQTYPRNYFRNPLDIPMQLVANFGELRSNHWHMGLDIRTQQRENLPVYAAAEGYISAVSVDANGFGRAIYINHPNGLTTLYAHLNNFEPRLQAWLKAEQYKQESWAGKWQPPPHLFPLKRGDLIAYSGNTGGSQGPHVHFEIRHTQTDKCLNPLLFHFPMPDAMPPTLLRLALFDRTRSVYAQTPKLFGLKKAGSYYTPGGPVLKVSGEKISFALGAVDRLSPSTGANGIYSAHIFVDGMLQSGFVLDSISYDETRYLNAHIDYRYKAGGGPYLQHLSKLPGERSGVYTTTAMDGVIDVSDAMPHNVVIDVLDAAGNKSTIKFTVQYDANFLKSPYPPAAAHLLPNEVNVVEQDAFELYTSGNAVYDTVPVTYSTLDVAPDQGTGPAHLFLSHTVPTHDSVTVRLKGSGALPEAYRDRLIIYNTSGTKKVVEKAAWNEGWARAKFRQFGTYQAFIDTIPPTVNAPGVGDTIDLRRATRLVFTPQDNFKTIKRFRAELDGQWLLFSNDKGGAFIYQFDNYFTPGVHELTVTVADVAGNTMVKRWWVRR